MNLALRIARLEAKARPGDGCGRCRGQRALGVGEFTVEHDACRTRCRCVNCGRALDARTALIAIDIREVI